MAEFVVTPDGRDAVSIGKLVDDDGAEFVCMIFGRPDADRAIVTFTVDLFHDLARHMQNVSNDIRQKGF